jgi:hypothetical protein
LFRARAPEDRRPYGQKIETVEKTVKLSIPSIASPGAAGYDFLGKQLRIGWRGGRMDWARILAFVTGMVDQELLARIEYLAAENRILKTQRYAPLFRQAVNTWWCGRASNDLRKRPSWHWPSTWLLRD